MENSQLHPGSCCTLVPVAVVVSLRLTAASRCQFQTGSIEAFQSPKATTIDRVPESRWKNCQDIGCVKPVEETNLAQRNHNSPTLRWLVMSQIRGITSSTSSMLDLICPSGAARLIQCSLLRTQLRQPLDPLRSPLGYHQCHPPCGRTAKATRLKIVGLDAHCGVIGGLF